MPDRNVPPAIHELNGLVLPAVTGHILPNGIPLKILRQGVQPVCRITFQWAIGKSDVDDPAALSLLMMMLLEGTGSKSGSHIAEALEYNGAWKSIETAAHHISLSLFMLNHSSAELLPLVRDIITDSVIPADTLATLAARQAAQIDLKKQKVDYLAGQQAMVMAYGEHHPFSREINSEDMLRVTRDDVMELYKNIICRYPPQLFAAGSITPSLEAEIESVFGSIHFASPTAAPKPLHIPAEGLTVPTTGKIIRPESLQTAICIKMPIAGMSHNHPDYEKLRIAVAALGGYFGSRLMSNIREEKGYTYGITAYLSSTQEGAFVTISTQTDNANVDAVLHEIENEINRLVSEPPEKEELEIIKHTMTSSLANLLDSPFTVMDYHRQVEGLGLDGSRYAMQVQTISEITSDDIRSAASSHLLSAPRLISLAGA